MQHPHLRCEITGDSFEGVQSRKIGHAQEIGNIQTNGLQTSGANYEQNSTKASREATDWLSDNQHQVEARMHKNPAEAAGDIEYEEPGSKTKNSTNTADSSSHTSTESVAAGMQIPMCLQLPNRTIQMLKSAMRNPPVTVSTLGELNLTWMMHYINLRCDINFDHDLHFTPIKGPRGEEKRSQAIDYWIALEAEFRIYQHPSQKCTACEIFGNGILGKFQPRLSTMFQNLKDLLETLVPDKDHDQVATNLDIDFITQQVEKGVLDVGRLSRWLAKLLKSHCAPMRDESAEAMASKLEFGANNGDLSTLINGLESLFGFLEAMKLDVANHQIRTFRYILIEETVAFQQSHFRKRIDDGRLNLAAAEAWYEQAYTRHRSRSRSSSSVHLPTKDHESETLVFEFEAFLHGFVALCSSSPHAQTPPITLHYDQSRIAQLRADVEDLVFLRLCVDVFNELLTHLRCRNPIPQSAYANLQTRLLTIADEADVDADGTGQASAGGFIPWISKTAELATEITRAAFDAAASPHPHPHLHLPATAFSRTQSYLTAMFTARYTPAETEILSRLAEETVMHAAIFQKMSTKDISEAQRLYQQGRGDRESCAGFGLNLPDLENMSRMVAHVGVVHWRVWRDLAYVKEGMENWDVDGDVEGEGMSPEQVDMEAYDENSAVSEAEGECEGGVAVGKIEAEIDSQSQSQSQARRPGDNT